MDQASPESPSIADAHPGAQVRVRIAENLNPSIYLQIQATDLDPSQSLQQEPLGEGGRGGGEVGGVEGPGWVNTGTRLIHSQKASQ